MVIKIETPIITDFSDAVIGTAVEISGIVYTARDAVMPKLINVINGNQMEDFPMKFQGAAIMHTAFSPAGYGPTSSNKEEIESAMGILSKAGVKLHLGKGAIKQKTIDEISKYGAMFIVVPPVSALLQDRLIQKKVIAFKEEGMEALHELTVIRLPGIIAAANGLSIFNR